MALNELRSLRIASDRQEAARTIGFESPRPVRSARRVLAEGSSERAEAAKARPVAPLSFMVCSANEMAILAGPRKALVASFTPIIARALGSCILWRASAM